MLYHNLMKKRMIITVIIAVILLVALGIFSYLTLHGLLGQMQEIVVTDNGFQPVSITIQKNTRVIFVNKGTKPRWPASDFHPTHGIYPEFDPQNEVPPGGKWEFVFGKVGKWKYHDHLEPENKGIIIVN